MGKGDVGERGAIGICPSCGRGDRIVWNPATDVSKCMRCGWHNNEPVAEMEKIIDGIPCNAYIEWDDEAYACANEIAEALYNAGYRKQSEGEWISVDERLPEDGKKRVAVFLQNNPLIAAMGSNRIDTDRYLNGKWVRWGKWITHWMPLPEPPKGE